MFRTAKETRKRYSAQMSTADPRDVSALAALVQRVVDESGDSTGFDALVWTTHWLHQPASALGGARRARSTWRRPKAERSSKQ